ncbi:MAG: N-6 DNA methylase [Cyanobacteria bacterium P01_D01_bin.56]
MVGTSSLFDAAVETAQRIWQLEPVRHVRMPEPNARQTVPINALWTDSGLRPRANNLAFLIQQVDSREDLERWKQRMKAWTIRGGLLVLDTLHLVQPSSNSSTELIEEQLDLASWNRLISSKPYLFTPKQLAENKQGQLSLADLEETVSERSFTFLTRQQSRIDEAFQQGIDAAIKAVSVPRKDSFSTQIQGHVIRYSIAYLAARILQDKNFFGSGATIHDEDQDPITLLNWMIDRANGFFREAKKSEAFIFEHARPSFVPMREALVQHMGYNVSFVLTDHRDVGRLYEEAIKKLPRELGSDDLGDLNRHYTPVKLAERMLEALPLERLRPEERFIFDPAAGSGSLLLAATSRLAGMRDIPTGEERKEYLRSHVIGNDLDRYASLVTKLRYFLASESLGVATETSEIADILPFPSSFTTGNYQELTRDKLPIYPRIIVANPPFAIEGNIQKSANFVEQATNWLQEGDQFSFVLPSSFLTSGNKFGISTIRENLSKKCKLFEVWQCPEGTVGVDARQDVCILIGEVGNSKNNYLVSRAVISRAEASTTRKDGYLGSSWLAKNDPSNDLGEVSAPEFKLNTPTIPLGKLFFVFNGVKPLRGKSPVAICPDGRTCKPTWRMSWGRQGSMWADPEKVDPQKRLIIYDSDFLEGLRKKESHLFQKDKILIGCIANIASRRPIKAQLDTEGFCPTNSVWCVLPIEEAKRNNSKYSSDEKPEGWEHLSFKEQKLWLLGILCSELGAFLSTYGRDKVNLTKPTLLKFPLPHVVDYRVINKTAEIITHEQRQGSLEDDEILHQELNNFVEAAYGNPNWINRKRVGLSGELENWKREQIKQSLTVTGQVLELSQERSEVILRLSGLLDENEKKCISLPQELPGWALDGTVFEAQLSEDIETFQELVRRPWALRKFRHTPYPYLSNDELKTRLSRMVGREIH